MSVKVITTEPFNVFPLFPILIPSIIFVKIYSQMLCCIIKVVKVKEMIFPIAFKEELFGLLSVYEVDVNLEFKCCSERCHVYLYLCFIR
ncbi:hypothetical protein BSZ21_00365 [Bradyrhizobium canariense]|nr:hypothetical protein BSZ20_00565 [Bradyrhizobium canariense]OSI81167.1 hypothetical protein BSZ21_00365 [Bradyrhizobium canariense]